MYGRNGSGGRAEGKGGWVCRTWKRRGRRGEEAISGRGEAAAGFGGLFQDGEGGEACALLSTKRQAKGTWPPFSKSQKPAFKPAQQEGSIPNGHIHIIRKAASKANLASSLKGPTLNGSSYSPLIAFAKEYTAGLGEFSKSNPFISPLFFECAKSHGLRPSSLKEGSWPSSFLHLTFCSSPTNGRERQWEKGLWNGEKREV